MDWGMRNRLSGIMRPDTGRCVMLAIDHGYFQGPTTGLERPGETVAPLLDHADALMLTRGVLRSAIDPGRRVPIVLRVSGGTSILKDDLSDEDLTVSIEDAIRLNASALALSIFVGRPHEKETLTNLARLCDDGQRYGIPVLAVTAVGKEMARDARYLGLATRIAAAARIRAADYGLDRSVSAYESLCRSLLRKRRQPVIDSHTATYPQEAGVPDSL